MSKTVASETIKQFNPKNISGILPQALDLQKTLKESKGNPKMVDSVGLENLMAAFKSLMALFAVKSVIPPTLTPLDIIAILKKIPLIPPLDATLQLAALKELIGLDEINKLLTLSVAEINSLTDALIATIELSVLVKNFEAEVRNISGHVINMIQIQAIARGGV